MRLTVNGFPCRYFMINLLLFLSYNNICKWLNGPEIILNGPDIIFLVAKIWLTGSRRVGVCMYVWQHLSNGNICLIIIL